MNRGVVMALAAVCALGLLWYTWQDEQRPAPPRCPGPDCPRPVDPGPDDDAPPPRRPRPRRPWGPREALASPAVAGIGALPPLRTEKRTDEPCPAGPCRKAGQACECRPCRCVAAGAVAAVGDREPMIDLLAMPASARKRNIASSGLGCCTFRSAEYCARWSHVPALFDLPEWMKQNGIAGGGVPKKQAQVIARCAKDRGLPVPRIYQYEGPDPAPVIERILKTGRPCGVTWGGDHMLVCVHLDATRAAILDNNAPDRVQWFERREFLSRVTTGGGGWVFALLAPPPPPPPAGSVVGASDELARLRAELADYRARGFSPDYVSCRMLARQIAALERLEAARKPAPKTRPKVAPKVEPAAPKKVIIPLPADDRPLGGVVNWTPPERARWWVGAEEVSHEKWEAEFPDDSAKLHLTYVSDGNTVPLVRSDLASRYQVQVYRAGHWATRCGFVPGSVYLQDRTGRVLMRAPLTAVDLLERLRRADPSYDPRRDPDGTAGMPSLDLARLKCWAKKHQGECLLAVLAAAGAGLYLATRKQTGAPVTRAAPRASQPAPAATQAAPPGSLDELALTIGREEVRRRVSGAQVLAAAGSVPAPAPPA